MPPRTHSDEAYVLGLCDEVLGEAAFDSTASYGSAAIPGRPAAVRVCQSTRSILATRS
jgi:hypothetical protein